MLMYMRRASASTILRSASTQGKRTHELQPVVNINRWHPFPSYVAGVSVDRIWYLIRDFFFNFFFRLSKSGYIRGIVEQKLQMLMYMQRASASTILRSASTQEKRTHELQPVVNINRGHPFPSCVAGVSIDESGA